MMTVNIDTYVTVEESDEFVNEMYPPAHPLRVTWEALSQDEKARFLSVALERTEQLNYIGHRVNYFQPLKFPRIANGIPADFEHAPLEVKRAQTAWAADIVREELYVKRRNNDACIALGLIKSETDGISDETPKKVRELLFRWLTNWRKI